MKFWITETAAAFLKYFKVTRSMWEPMGQIQRIRSMRLIFPPIQKKKNKKGTLWCFNVITFTWRQIFNTLQTYERIGWQGGEASFFLQCEAISWSVISLMCVFFPDFPESCLQFAHLSQFSPFISMLSPNWLVIGIFVFALTTNVLKWGFQKASKCIT